MEDLTPKRALTSDLARDILKRFITEEEVRRRFAAKNRKSMHEQINRGEEPTGHRMEFICETVKQVVDTLMKSAEKYNQTYPYDIVLLGDYLDILATTRARFLAAAGLHEQSS